MQKLYHRRFQFLFISIGTPGSSHDYMKLQLSDLFWLLHCIEGGLVEGYWIAGYQAYVCTKSLFTPWPFRTSDITNGCSNYCLSLARIHIEELFGVLVGLWRLLWRRMRVQVKTATQIVLVFANLKKCYIKEHSSTMVLQHF